MRTTKTAHCKSITTNCYRRQHTLDHKLIRIRVQSGKKLCQFEIHTSQMKMQNRQTSVVNSECSLLVERFSLDHSKQILSKCGGVKALCLKCHCHITLTKGEISIYTVNSTFFSLSLCSQLGGCYAHLSISSTF